MKEVQSIKVGNAPSLKNGNWEIILTDPSLNKFNFGHQITDTYITTDIISPFGEKSILYNTIQRDTIRNVVIALNFQDIDQTKIAKLIIKASKPFFQNWKLSIKDNRIDEVYEIEEETDFSVSPTIELNKLSSMGFVEGALEKGSSFFELHLQRKNN